jgi:hypothetical protein
MAFAVGNQHTKQRAQFEQLMPIPIVASETRRIQAQDQAGFAQTHFRNQCLEAMPISAGRPGLTKIVVDDMNPFPWPTKQGCTLDQAILQLRALLVMAHLPWR